VAREKAGLQATYDLRMLVPAATGADLTANRCVPARGPSGGGCRSRIRPFDAALHVRCWSFCDVLIPLNGRFAPEAVLPSICASATLAG
jgi:hypothetical protein